MTALARAGAVAGVAALVLLPAAAGHVTVEPTTVQLGTTATLSVTVPNEREARATIGLTVTFPPGWKPVAAPSHGDWRATATGDAITWSGGRLTGSQAATFTVRALPVGRAGTRALQARQRYDDGDVVSWRVPVATLPAAGTAAPSEHLGRAVVAAVVGTVLIVALLGVLRALRRSRRHVG
jgi:uncharacterized protein YcnI